MHVLMISLDSRLATEPDGDTVQRHRDYAARAGSLTIIVYTPPGVGDARRLSDSLTVIPTNSRSRFTFVADALRLALDVSRQHRPDLITTQDPFSTGLVGWLLRSRAKAPVLVQNHCYFIDNDAWLAENPVKNHLFNRLGKFVSRRADVYRTVNKHEADTYLHHGGDPARVFTQPLGTASDAFAQPTAAAVAGVRERLGLRPAHKVVIWVGFPVGFKRVPLLLEAFRRVYAQQPDARLLLVGDLAKSADDLPALIRQHGLQDAVLTPGFVSHDDLPAYYAVADVFLMTSAYEGIPRVLMEASAAGLPLVAFDRVGVREVIADGQNGYLLPEGDLEGMAARVIDLLNDPQTANQLGQHARALSVERFSAAKNAQNVAAMWQQAVTLGLR